MLNPISILQLQVSLATLEAALRDVKEYKEDWRKTPVLRQGGRFASGKPGGSNVATPDKFRGLTSAVIAVQDKAGEAIRQLDEKRKSSIESVIKSPIFDRLRQGVKESLPVETKPAFDRVMDDIKDSKLPLQERLKKAGYLLSKEMQAVTRNASPSHAAILAMAAITVPIMCSALDPRTIDELEVIDLEQNKVENRKQKDIGILLGALSIYGVANVINDIHNSAKELMEEEERKSLEKQHEEFKDNLISRFQDAISVESGKKQLTQLTDAANRSTRSIQDFLVNPNISDVQKQLGETLGAIDRSMKLGYQQISTKIEALVHGKKIEEPVKESEQKDNSKLKWIVAGAVAATALAVGGAVIYKAETRELKEDEALDGGLDKAMNSLGKFLRKGDIEKVGGELEEFNKTRKVATYTGTSFDQGKLISDTLGQVGLKRDDVLDVLKREKDPALPKQKHTVSDRVKELPKLAKSDKEEDALSLEWHRGIINAEVKYGESINSLVKSDRKDTLPKGWRSGLGIAYQPTAKTYGVGAQTEELQKSYSNFLGILNKKTPSSNIKKLGNREKIVEKEGDTTKTISDITGTDKVSKESVDTALKYAKEFQGYLNGSLGEFKVGRLQIETKTKFGRRGETRKVETFPYPSYRNGVYNVGDASKVSEVVSEEGIKSVAFHELGHGIEQEKGLSGLTWNYIDSRTILPLKKVAFDDNTETKLIKTPEIKRHDFPYQYTAKKYRGEANERNSELISTATQMLSNPINLHRAATIDREHLMFGLFAMDK